MCVFNNGKFNDSKFNDSELRLIQTLALSLARLEKVIRENKDKDKEDATRTPHRRHTDHPHTT